MAITMKAHLTGGASDGKIIDVAVPAPGRLLVPDHDGTRMGYRTVNGGTSFRTYGTRYQLDNRPSAPGHVHYTAITGGTEKL
jgi:hypothetical protein